MNETVQKIECHEVLFDNKVKIWIPNGFYEDSELIEKRYPYKNKPSIIKVDSSGEAFITFDLFSKPLSASQIIDAAVSIRNSILQIYSYNEKKTLQCFKTIQGMPGACFSFFTMNKCGRQFIEFSVLSIHSQLFLSTVTCPEEKRYKWNSAFLKVKRSVQEME